MDVDFPSFALGCGCGCLTFWVVMLANYADAYYRGYTHGIGLELDEDDNPNFPINSRNNWGGFGSKEAFEKAERGG